MTTLRDLINDAIVTYIQDTREGCPDDAEVFTDGLCDDITDFFTKNLSK